MKKLSEKAKLQILLKDFNNNNNNNSSSNNNMKVSHAIPEENGVIWSLCVKLCKSVVGIVCTYAKNHKIEENETSSMCKFLLSFTVLGLALI